LKLWFLVLPLAIIIVIVVFSFCHGETLESVLVGGVVALLGSPISFVRRDSDGG
jgi:hypothetical protein